MRLTEEEYQKLQERLQRVPANLPEPIKRATTPKPFKLKMQQPSEDDEQANLAKYLDYLSNRHGFRWCHCPNGGTRNVIEAAKLKRNGVKPGVPDCLIFAAPPGVPGAKGIAIELKKRHGGTVSEFQEEWLAYLEKEGWCCYVAKGWDDARKFLVGLGF